MDIIFCYTISGRDKKYVKIFGQSYRRDGLAFSFPGKPRKLFYCLFTREIVVRRSVSRPLRFVYAFVRGKKYAGMPVKTERRKDPRNAQEMFPREWESLATLW